MICSRCVHRKNRACVWRLEYAGNSVYATVVKHNDEAASQFVGYALASPKTPRDARHQDDSIYAIVSPLPEKSLPITLFDEK